jgi:hypothetical protein
MRWSGPADCTPTLRRLKEQPPSRRESAVVGSVENLPLAAPWPIASRTRPTHETGRSSAPRRELRCDACIRERPRVNRASQTAQPSEGPVWSSPRRSARPPGDSSRASRPRDPSGSPRQVRPFVRGQVCRSNRLQLNLHDPEAAAVTASRSGAATSGRCRQVRPADRPAAQPDADGGGLLR